MSLFFFARLLSSGRPISHLSFSWLHISSLCSSCRAAGLPITYPRFFSVLLLISLHLGLPQLASRLIICRILRPSSLPRKPSGQIANFAIMVLFFLENSESRIGQNDRSSHSSLAPHVPLWKHFISEVIPEILIFTPFGRR